MNELVKLASILTLCAFTTACSDPKPAKAPAPPQPQTQSDTAAPTPATQPNHLIREAIGVGGAELGMTEAQIREKLGEPLHVNKAGDQVVFMSYHATQNFGIYMGDDGRVRMIIAALQDKTWCTDFEVCLYREGDLPKLVAHHGTKLLRFVDRDQSVTYRLLTTAPDGRKIMTEYTPNEEHKGVAQVAILYWSGNIDTSGFD